jgi:hypothetical protein
LLAGVKALLIASGGYDREADTSGNSRRLTEFDPERILAFPESRRSQVDYDRTI